jgi:two-component system phosphate regulon response regulator PhoB
MTTGNKAIILTTANDTLISDLAELQPTLEIIRVGAQLPDLPVAMKYWCFIDWLLADISGLEICRRLRALPATRNAHITMVLQTADEAVRRQSILTGADDYILGRLDARTIIRRLGLDLPEPEQDIASARLILGDLQVDKAAYIVRYQGRRIALAMNEFRLLIHFVEHPNRVFTRAGLIDTLSKRDSNVDERTVDVWIGRLRRAFKSSGAPDPLRTVRSVGYILDYDDHRLSGLPVDLNVKQSGNGSALSAPEADARTQ